MRGLAIIAFLLLLQPAGASAAEMNTENRFLIGMPEWCPYTCDDPEKPGILVELTKKIFEKKGITPEFRIYDNWKRLVYEGRKGRVDAVLAIGPNEEPSLSYPDESMVDVFISFFVRAGDPWKYIDNSSFENKVLLVYDNVDYGPRLQPYIDEHKNDRSRIELATGETEEVVIHKLAAGRGDIYLEDKHVALYMIKNEGLQGKVKMAPRATKPYPVGLGLGFSPAFKNARDYSRVVDEGIKELEKSGERETIIHRYIADQ
jgi:polar amino acid transport system substrate-binding protein